MQISIVILNYNVRFFLEQCVLSVEKALQNIEGEIIVVDNNSPDDSCAMMKQRFPHIKLIENNENTGFPRGNNIGVEEAKGEYLCILNPDTVVAEDTFEKLLSFAQTKTDLGIIGCKLIDGSGRFLQESKRGVPTPYVAITKMAGLYKLFPKLSAFGKYYAQHLPENQTGKVEVLVGAFMLMRLDFYRDLGGFDEAFFMYGEDIDLSYRSVQSGKSNYYFSETSVIHYKGESTVKNIKYLQSFKSAMELFYKKHFKVSLVFKTFMNFGAFVFSTIKMNQTSGFTKKIDAYLLFSNSQNQKVKVENLLGKKVTLIDSTHKNGLNSPTDKSIEIIFDNNVWSFKSIIDFMERHRSKQITFKILPSNSDFIIGSNSSIDRGEVIGQE
jgi:GT2 family glycosyltransferase